MEKVITFTIEAPNGSMTSDEPKTLIDCLFGTGDYPHVSCPSTIKSLFDDLQEGETVTYTITVEKKFTREELENLHESDGDIH
jgi:hypothetical protein